MGRFMILGGGEIGRPGYPIETLTVDRELVRMSGKRRPKLLFLPTASKDSSGYEEVVRGYFGERLGCRVDALRLWKERYARRELRERILGADIIYVGGGNTMAMMKRWRELGVDKLLHEAHARGVVLSGLSAGGVCWFRYGSSDCWKMSDPSKPYIKIRGLDLLPVLHCPHTHREPDRLPSLKEMMRKTAGVAIALDDCAALQIVDGEYRILASKPGRRGYKCYWSRGRYHAEPLAPSRRYLPLEGLLGK